LLHSLQSAGGARQPSSSSKRFRGGVEASDDGQEIVSALGETRYGEEGSFIGQYAGRQHSLDQPILEELEETDADDQYRVSDDVSDYAGTADI